jgi:AraC-like DNA-binding protein
MDAVAGLLDGPRAQRAFVLRTTMSAPWALRLEDEAPLALLTVTRGHAWLRPAEGPAVRLEVGDVVLARGTAPYTLADDAATPVSAVIGPGQTCTTLSGAPLVDAWSHGVRTWGNDPDGPTVLLTGVYEARGEVPDRLLRTLPPTVVVPRDAFNRDLLELLEHEAQRDVPGQEAVLDRLLDLLVVLTLRAWFTRPEAEAPAWYRAQADPVIGRALSLMHHHPEHPWTLAALAREVGLSRAALAKRFADLVGEPPMAFLTGWRLALAADLLLEPGQTIGSVAAQVGYSSPFALSAAFKRVRGISPQQHRRAAA